MYAGLHVLCDKIISTRSSCFLLQVSMDTEHVPEISQVRVWLINGFTGSA